jgi:hypothetical protein
MINHVSMHAHHYYFQASRSSRLLSRVEFRSERHVVCSCVPVRQSLRPSILRNCIPPKLREVSSLSPKALFLSINGGIAGGGNILVLATSAFVAFSACHPLSPAAVLQQLAGSSPPSVRRHELLLLE